MVRKRKQAGDPHQDLATAQPEAAVEQDRQRAQRQDDATDQQATKQADAPGDHSQDADRHSKFRHAHSHK